LEGAGRQQWPARTLHHLSRAASQPGNANGTGYGSTPCGYCQGNYQPGSHIDPSPVWANSYRKTSTSRKTHPCVNDPPGTDAEFYR